MPTATMWEGGQDVKKEAARVSKERVDPAASIKYEAVLDWSHYHVPRDEQQRLTSVSVGDMYWRIVAPIREQVGLEPLAHTPRLGGQRALTDRRKQSCCATHEGVRV